MTTSALLVLTLSILHAPVKLIFSEVKDQSQNHIILQLTGALEVTLIHFPHSSGEETEAKEIKWLA